MNAAVLMFTACLAGAEPMPAAQPYGPAAQPYSPVPVVVYGNARGSSDCCGHASVCGNCDAHECCLKKIWSKLSCFNWCDKGHGGGCNFCSKGNQGCAPACPAPKPVCNPCPKPVCPPCPKPVCKPCPAPKPVCQPCPKPVCNPCPKPACNPCPKPACNPCPKQECPKQVCTKVKPDCNMSSKCCGGFLHKCKEKLSGLCGGHSKGGGCGTAATPNPCGTTVIPPATTVPVVPGTAVPVAPPVAPKAMPEVPKVQSNVGSSYNVVRPSLTTDGSAPKTIDLSANPF